MNVVVAMSGGVDSSVAAALAAEAGHEAVGVTLRHLRSAPGPSGDYCGSPAAVEDAREVCDRLGIEHRVADSSEVYEREVLSPFVEDYLRGRTPNPCVECNRSVKFGLLLDIAASMGASCLVTGHYARTAPSEGGGLCRLLRAADRDKDQSYFLYTLTQEKLRRVLFPLGDLTKAAVREKARSLGLPNADREESHDICFLPDRDYRRFVRGRAEASGRGGLCGPGEIRDRSGRVLGRHTGLADYTIGQRRGLGLSSPRPLYVTGKDAATNTLTVGEAGETLCRRFRAGRVSWTRGEPEPGACRVSIRYRAEPAAAVWAALPDGELMVELREPRAAAAPGQAAVFYDGDEVLGGGTIEEAL